MRGVGGKTVSDGLGEFGNGSRVRARRAKAVGENLGGLFPPAMLRGDQSAKQGLDDARCLSYCLQRNEGGTSNQG